MSKLTYKGTEVTLCGLPVFIGKDTGPSKPIVLGSFSECYHNDIDIVGTADDTVLLGRVVYKDTEMVEKKANPKESSYSVLMGVCPFCQEDIHCSELAGWPEGVRASHFGDYGTRVYHKTCYTKWDGSITKATAQSVGSPAASPAIATIFGVPAIHQPTFGYIDLRKTLRPEYITEESWDESNTMNKHGKTIPKYKMTLKLKSGTEVVAEGCNHFEVYRKLPGFLKRDLDNKE